MLQAIETEQYADAADLLNAASDTVAATALNLFDTVAQGSQAAGRGQGALAWARGYDTSAEQVLTRLCQLVAALGNTGVLLEATGHNHARAEAAAAHRHLAGAAPGTAAGVLPPRPHPGFTLAGLPSVYGGDDGDDGAPRGWHWLANRLDGLLWPGADTTRFDRIGSAWLAAATHLRDTGWLPLQAVDALEAQQSPDIADATTVCTRLAAEILTVADACEALGHQCHAFAAAVHQARESVLHLVKEFLAITAISEITGAVLSFFTAGASELFSKLLDTGVVASYAARITAYLRALDLTLNTLVPGLATQGLTDAWLLAVSDAEPVIAALGEAGTAGRAAASAAQAAGAAAKAGAAAEAAATGGRLTTITRELLEHWEQTTKSHTIRKHVGKTIDQLRERLAKEPLRERVSTFEDIDQAAAHIDRTIEHNMDGVTKWLAGKKDSVTVSYTSDTPVGVVLHRDGTLADGHATVAVLVRDVRSPLGFRVHTAFVEP